MAEKAKSTSRQILTKEQEDFLELVSEEKYLRYYPFPRIERGMKYKQIEVDSAYDIAVNKVHTIAMKPRARDFIDVYFLVQEKKYTMMDLLMQAKAKFDWHIDPVQLGSRFFQASEVADYPRMIKPINHDEWKNFFIEEARKLKKEIFK